MSPNRGKAIWLTALVVFLISSSLLGIGCLRRPPEARPGQEPLTIGITPWSSTIPPSYAVRIILEEQLGYEVKETEADVGVVFSGLFSGDIDIFLDYWVDLHRNYFDEYQEHLIDVGISYTNANLGWVVPTYVPIDSIPELKENRDHFKGQIIGIDPGAGLMTSSAEALKTYGLDYELVEGSEWAMLAELERAINNEEWIVVTSWRPHWMFAQYDLKFLDDPEGVFVSDEVHTLINENLSPRAPKVVEFLANWHMPLEDLEEMIYRIEVNEEDPREVAREWVENNREEIDAILP